MQLALANGLLVGIPWAKHERACVLGFTFLALAFYHEMSIPQVATGLQRLRYMWSRPAPSPQTRVRHSFNQPRYPNRSHPEEA